MKITYDPSKDELTLVISRVERKPNKKVGPFKLWWDDEGNIYAFVITNYLEVLKEFKRNLNVISLGGIWKGIKITEEDIKEVREELLRRLEDR